MRTWAAAIVAVGMVTGCNYGAAAFHCDDQHVCGANATCETSTGFCTVLDSRCGPDGRVYTDLSGSLSGQCVGGGRPGDDAAIDSPPDARVCFGTAPFTICLAAAPTTPLTISAPTTIDTAASPMCVATISGASNYCVIAATKITVDATLRAAGAKPLVLLASDSIEISATVDVGSHRGATRELGAGADPISCDAGTAPTIGSSSSGGGAGGSFLGLGGAGGKGGNGGLAGGTPGAVVSTVTELRGGCPGQDGAGSPGGNSIGGHGGGAVFLIAGNQILLVSGGINAGGEGGGGGVNCGVLLASAGGGGGAGGMIGFDAPIVFGSGLILANGGGGGGACDDAAGGAAMPGGDATAVTTAIGGSGSSSFAGAGGNGSAGISAGPGEPGGDGSCGRCSGGGGGGGAGLIQAPATAGLGTMVSPPPTP